MTITLHLGVTDIAYSWQEPRKVKVSAKPGRRPKPKPKVRVTTTGDVAEILEAKYHVIRNFVELHPEVIEPMLEASVRGAIENLMLGASTSNDPFGAATAKIETAFQKFIDTREMEGIGYPGVPTKAALKGINHRLLHPYAKANPRRPSFRDTGLYADSFIAWVTGY